MHVLLYAGFLACFLFFLILLLFTVNMHIPSYVCFLSSFFSFSSSSSQSLSNTLLHLFCFFLSCFFPSIFLCNLIHSRNTGTFVCAFFYFFILFFAVGASNKQCNVLSWETSAIFGIVSVGERKGIYRYGWNWAQAMCQSFGLGCVSHLG